MYLYFMFRFRFSMIRVYNSGYIKLNSNVSETKGD